MIKILPLTITKVTLQEPSHSTYWVIQYVTQLHSQATPLSDDDQQYLILELPSLYVIVERLVLPILLSFWTLMAICFGTIFSTFFNAQFMVLLCWSIAFLKKDLQEMWRLVKDLTFSKASISDKPVQRPSRIYPNLHLRDICMIK